MDEPPEAILMLFGLGVATDLVWTFTIGEVAKRRFIPAAIGNALIAAIGLASYWWVIEARSLPAAIAYIIGCAVGTLLVKWIDHRNTVLVPAPAGAKIKRGKKRTSKRKSKKSKK